MLCQQCWQSPDNSENVTDSAAAMCFVFSLSFLKKWLRMRLTRNAFLALRQMFWCHQNFPIRRLIFIMTFRDGAAQLSHSVIWVDENALDSVLFEPEKQPLVTRRVLLMCFIGVGLRGSG